MTDSLVPGKIIIVYRLIYGILESKCSLVIRKKVLALVGILNSLYK